MRQEILLSTPYEIKQVIVVRTHYPDGKGGVRKIRWGKSMAQAAHASMAVFFDRRMRLKDLSQADSGIGKFLGRWGARLGLIVPLTEDMAAWVEGSFAKIVLAVESEEDLLRIYSLAKEADLPVSLITDAGNTEFKQECPSCAGTGRPGVVLIQTKFEQRVEGPFPVPSHCEQCEGTGKIGKPTTTAVAIGPAKREMIDKITGKDGAVATKLL